MAKCAACGATILFGGQQVGERRYCDVNCRNAGMVAEAAGRLDQGELQSFIQQLHAGPCPKCQGSGPVEVFRIYKVWSALILTRWSNIRQISCRSCAAKAQWGGIGFSLLFGWWGFPWGLIMTPVQVVRNVRGLLRTPDPYRPSADLENEARVRLVAMRSAAR